MYKYTVYRFIFVVKYFCESWISKILRKNVRELLQTAPYGNEDAGFHNFNFCNGAKAQNSHKYFRK